MKEKQFQTEKKTLKPLKNQHKTNNFVNTPSIMVLFSFVLHLMGLQNEF